MIAWALSERPLSGRSPPFAPVYSSRRCRHGPYAADALLPCLRVTASSAAADCACRIFRAGKEVGRHIGSSKGDLIGQILQQQSSFGISPPPPPVTAAPKARRGLVRKARS